MYCGKFVPPPMLNPRSVMTGGSFRSLATGLRAAARPVVAFHVAVGPWSQWFAAQPTFSSLRARLLITRVNDPETASAYLSNLIALAGWFVAPPIVACVPSSG